MVKKIAVVILNYQNIEETLRIIEEFKEQTGNLEIIVVDNNSQDNSHAILSNMNDIIYIQTNENLGYARGNNIGINYAIENIDLDFIIVSNNDVYLTDKNTITSLKQIINNLPSNWGYLGPTIRNSDRSIFQFVPKKHTTLLERFINSTLFGLPFRKLYNPVTNNEKSNQIIESEVISGSFFMLNPKAVKKIGAFDPYTFLYGEERILAKKYYDSGYKGFITNDVEVLHANAATTKKYPVVSYINSLKGEYYYFTKYQSIGKVTQKSLIFIRLIDTLVRVVIGGIHRSALKKTLKMYVEIQRELK